MAKQTTGAADQGAPSQSARGSGVTAGIPFKRDLNPSGGNGTAADGGATAAAVSPRHALLHGGDPRPTCVAVAPGRGLVTCDGNGAVTLWDLKEKPIGVVGSHPNVKASYVAVAQDFAFVAFFDGTVKVWNLANPGSAPVVDFKDHAPKSECWVLAVAENGTRVISATNGGEIVIWEVDLKTGQTGALARKTYSEEPVPALAFIPPAMTGQKETHFISGHGDGQVVQWDITDERNPVAAPLVSHGNSHQVNGLAVTRNGQTVVSCSLDMTVRRWDRHNGSAHQPPLEHDDIVWRVAVSDDGNTIASASEDGTVRVWDMTTTVGDKPRKTYRHTSAMGVAFVNDGEIVFTTTNPNDPVRVRKV